MFILTDNEGGFMKNFRHCLKGYVKVSVQGKQLERFLNLCANREIRIHMLCRSGEEEIQGIFYIKDFLKLRPIRKKTKVHIRILEKHGLPFFLFKSKKKKGFLAGILLCCVILLFLSTRIWNIHIEGNIINTTPQILAFLGEKGILHGMAKRQINCYEIAEMVRKQYPEITWVSAKLEGTRMILQIQEGNLTENRMDRNQPPCDLTADVEGTIVKMVTRSGIPLVKTGDICKKGDKLISGCLEILNDSQEVTRYAYVHADGDIYVKHSVSYYWEFPLEYEKEWMDEKETFHFYLKIGKWYFSLFPQKKTGWKILTEDYPLRLTENYCLPIDLGIITSRKFHTEKNVYTETEAKSIASERLHLYEEKLIQKGVQISENNVKIEVTRTACISRGTLEVIEKTGKETTVMQQEQLSERTA